MLPNNLYFFKFFILNILIRFKIRDYKAYFIPLMHHHHHPPPPNLYFKFPYMGTTENILKVKSP